ncbi:MAG: hypothetical protein JSS75_12500 [Bacteroidetes bacterium]|nr:hypothetical protein [Bacteroidota bacterium]
MARTLSPCSFGGHELSILPRSPPTNTFVGYVCGRPAGLYAAKPQHAQGRWHGLLVRALSAATNSGFAPNPAHE